MKRFCLNYLPLLLGGFVLNIPSMISANHDSALPPIADRTPKELTAHERERSDPYYWMRLSDEQKSAEKPDKHTQKVFDYLEAENAYLKTSMAHTEPLQEALYEEIVGRIKQKDESAPYFMNGYWYYTRFEEGKEYPIECRKKESLEGKEEIMLDANLRAVGQDYYNVTGLAVSPNNELLAFTEDVVGRRIYTIRFKNLKTGNMLADEIAGVDPGVAWANDDKTIFYTAKNPTTLLSEKIKRHTLGTPVTQNVVVYQELDTSFYLGVGRSKSGKYVIVSNSSTLVDDYHILSADTPNREFTPFTPREKNMKYSISHVGDTFYVRTNWKAENFRLMRVDASKTAKENWLEVIPHRPKVLLEQIDGFDRHLVLQERENGQTKLRIRDLQNETDHYLEFDESAYSAGIGYTPDMDNQWLRFHYSSLTTPKSTFDYHMGTGEKVLKKQREVVGGHDPKNYRTERLWAKGRDGTQIPISIVYKDGLVKNGKAPLLLYGYGSYGYTIDPEFQSMRLSLLDRGFAFAIAHIRGGQMLGRQWYLDGKLLKKKNTFYDFIDCAKFLIKEDYTSSESLYAQGGSAGGLLMGAVLNEEPSLFNGVLAAVPFVDVVTTMSDPSIPLTTNEYDEWGNPEDKQYFKYMLEYSPYDNISETDYTNLLVTSGLFDSQVQYWEPTKWVAKMRARTTSTKRLFLETDMDSGHGGASGRFKRYKRTALEFAFLLDLEGIGK